ncbi:MAG: hypothetical protein R3B40_20945 [Polyangiales bacterium]|nr:hypothetical protein [Sandaracinaceae bacterium]
MANADASPATTADPSTSRAAALGVAAASPDAAHRRARAEWLALYASDAEVRDPVGTPVCRKDHSTRPGTGKNDLELFFDTFIAGMQAMQVDVLLDVVVGDVVARDVVLRPTMAFGVESAIPTRLLYELTREDGRLVVQRLGAYWDASRATQRTLRAGLRGKGSMLISSARMARYLGRAWMQRYVKGTKEGARRPGREATLAFGDALRASDLEAARALCATGATFRLREQPLSLDELAALDLGLTLRDPIASGDVVTARCSALHGGRAVDGIAFATFERESRKLIDLRLLWE